MSNNIEIILDLDNLEIYDVIDLEEKKYPNEDTDSEILSEEKDKKEDAFRSSLVWQFVQDEFLHELLLIAKDEYCYSRRSRDGTERQILDREEVLWLTLRLQPDLMSYV